MTKTEFAARLKNACGAVLSAEEELTEIDSRFGDADHGLTMGWSSHRSSWPGQIWTQTACCPPPPGRQPIGRAVEQPGGGIQSMLDDAAMAVMTLNGGLSIVQQGLHQL